MSEDDVQAKQEPCEKGQVRLSALSVYNWGSFSGLHRASIHPEGTLITGDNGAGKSTFIDGLMALLLPAGRASFNVAAAGGERSDRSLLSYMRGSYGQAHDGSSTRTKSKREGAVVTAISAEYRYDSGEMLTLAGVFWTLQSTQSLADVKRIYVIAKRALPLKALLEAFGQANARALKQWLKADPSCRCFDESFADYQAYYRNCLQMDNENAPALLSRALGLKKIDDLTGLIRGLVLESTHIKEDARRVVDEFADLVAIHDKLLDARAQQHHLLKLPELKASIEQAVSALEALSAERDGLTSYLAEQSSVLWQAKIDRLKQELAALLLEIEQSEREEIAAQKHTEQCHEHYIQAGGGQIESLKKEREHIQSERHRTGNCAARYQGEARALQLDDSLTENQFLKNQSLAKGKLAEMASENHQSQDSFASKSGQFSALQEQQRSLHAELKAIRSRPDSNVEFKFLELRDELIQSLGFARSECIYIAELIDVKENFSHWQGAIERALGGHRTTLLVPKNHFSMVTQWLNNRHTGLHVRVQVVDATSKRESASFKPDGFLRKLLWREHPYRDWLKQHLARFDLHCVDSTNALDVTPFSITQQGLIHFDKGRFEKKDQHRIDDRRRWQLGFSNKKRIALLEQDSQSLEVDIQKALNEVERARKQLDVLKKREALWQKLTEYHFDDVNVSLWERRYQRVEADLKAIEGKGSALEKAKARWEVAKCSYQEICLQKQAQRIKENELSVQCEQANEQLMAARQAAKKALSQTTHQALAAKVGELKESDLPHIHTLENNCRQSIEQSLEKYRLERSRSENSAIGVMSSFSQKWELIAADWRCDLTAVDDYLGHLTQLEQEGLPVLVEQFKERLNKHATQSIAQLHQRLICARDEILERIDVINHVLSRTAFRVGSYLKLGAKLERYPHVQAFNQQVLTLLSQVTSDAHELRFEQLKQVVDILEKASHPSSANTLESLRLLDPRYQMSFYAEERSQQTHEVLDVLESSSGKSGGEKESFAGTIVAASLAYVLTPKEGEYPVYCTVFLDEAFSNTAEAVSRRVLKVFKALKIHVNLITPYKNLNLARESAKSLLIAERDPHHHESRLCEITWEDVDKQLAQKRLREQRSALKMEAALDG